MFHRYFPLYFWFLRLDVCHSLSVPGNSGRSSRKFLGTTEFFTTDCADAADPEKLQGVRFACPQRGLWTTLGLFLIAAPYVAAATEGGFLMTCSLPQRERSVAYNLTVDQYVNAIGAHAERTRTEIVHVLAAINPEV